jgi:allophanate hydrolase
MRTNATTAVAEDPSSTSPIERRAWSAWEAIQAAGRDPAWITVANRDQLSAQLDRLRGRDPAGCPLYGLTFAVKDNIDVAGWPTTAGCPGFAHTAKVTAPVVEALQDAGAILLGKTNLDQFATGLVGTRSPYGAVPNAFSPIHVSGGSSSGSASVVARGLVDFALGTDTAGSGRVPAGFNNLVGLKPTPGSVSAEGVLPACRTLDCVSVFALTPADAGRVYAVIGADARAGQVAARFHPRASLRLDFGPSPRLGAPASPWFCGPDYQDCFDEALGHARQLPGASLSDFDLGPLLEVARLLYDGPWVAERHAIVGDMIERGIAGIDPVVARVIRAAQRFSAADTFRAMYRVREIAAGVERLWERFDALMVPTAPGLPTLEAVAADPVLRNSELGHYTNFVNLLGWAAIAVPSGFTRDGLPFGVTFIGPAGSDLALLDLARRWQQGLDLPLGRRLEAGDRLADRLPPGGITSGITRVAVVGAHLRGMPLHHQLVSAGAALHRTTTTSPRYRLFALADSVPAKPGLSRVADEQGHRIEVEVYQVPTDRLGAFVSAIPPPLGLGNIELDDGEWVKGFICEPWALASAQDISLHGGWRAWLASKRP